MQSGRDLDERVDDRRIEMRPARLDDVRDRRFVRHWRLIQLARDDGVVDVDDRHHASRDWNRLAAKTLGIAGPVPPLVMRVDDILRNTQCHIVADTGGTLGVFNDIAPVPWVVTHLLQFLGRQFDDDLNLRTVPGETEPGMPGYVIADLNASRNINDTVQVFFGIQNMFDEQYIVQLLPTTTGSPRLVNGGLRVRWSGR